MSFGKLAALFIPKARNVLTIHLDKAISRQDKVPYRQAQEIDDHPADINHPTGRDKNEYCRQPQDPDQQDHGDGFLEIGRWLQGGVDDQSVRQAHRDWQDDRSE